MARVDGDAFGRRLRRSGHRLIRRSISSPNISMRMIDLSKAAGRLQSYHENGREGPAVEIHITLRLYWMYRPASQDFFPSFPRPRRGGDDDSL